jgi:MFS family permease
MPIYLRHPFADGFESRYAVFELVLERAASMENARQPGFMTGLSLLIPITLSVMAIVLLAPILPMLLDEFKTISGFEYLVPMILTVPALCVALFSPVAGMAGDYFGRRKLLLWSFVFYAIVGIMPVFLTNIIAIIVSRIGVGIAEALIMVLSTTMIGDYFKGEARDRWLAAQTAFASMSALLFFNLGGQLGQFGWRTPFWVYGSALVMLILVLKFTWEPAADGAEAQEAPKSKSWDGFPWTKMLTIIAVTIYGSVFFYTVQIQAPLGLTELGWKDPAKTGFWTSIASIGVPLGTYIYSRVGRWPVKRLLLIEFSMLAVGFVVMGTAVAPEQFLLGCFINQLGAGLLLPTLLVWAMSLLPFEIRSRGAGMWTGAFSVGQFLSPLAVTVAGKTFGGLLPSFTALGVSALAGVAIAVVGKFERGNAADGAGVAALHG